MIERFGATLRALREARTITVRRHNATWVSDRVETVVLSQNELAARAGLDAAAVNKLEAGANHPRRSTVSLLADALGADPHERDLLLASAGFLPQSLADADAEQLDTLLALVPLLLSGDARVVAPGVMGAR